MKSTKNFKLKLTKGSLNEAAGTFRGLLAAYNSVDLGNDVIEPGAFTKTLLHNDGFPLLWQHDPSKPIGRFDVSDSQQGLMADGKLVMSDPQARVAFDHLAAGTIKGMSIGYDVIKDELDEKGVRHLKELRLWEGSIVTFPMNQSALVTSVKGIDEAGRILREAAKSSDAEQIAQLRGLLKDITQLLMPADECQCGADDEEDCTCEENAADELAAKSILQQLAFELKGSRRGMGLL